VCLLFLPRPVFKGRRRAFQLSIAYLQHRVFDVAALFQRVLYFLVFGYLWNLRERGLLPTASPFLEFSVPSSCLLRNPVPFPDACSLCFLLGGRTAAFALFLARRFHLSRRSGARRLEPFQFAHPVSLHFPFRFLTSIVPYFSPHLLVLCLHLFCECCNLLLFRLLLALWSEQLSICVPL